MDQHETSDTCPDKEETPAVSVPKGVHFLSLCMIIGASIAILATTLLIPQMLKKPVVIAIVIPFVLLFGFCIYRGVRLWKFGPREYKWALALFAIQIPIVHVPGLIYDMYTGFVAAVQFGAVKNNILLNLGGGFHFYISAEVNNTYFGVNLFALAASIYLFRLISREKLNVSGETSES